MCNRKIQFIFWNVHQSAQNISDLLTYARQEKIDVVALCEAVDDENVPSLRGDYHRVTNLYPGDKPDIDLYVSGRSITPSNFFSVNKRFAMIRFDLWNINLIIAHLNSNITPDAEVVRYADISSMMDGIDRIESVNKSKHTVILGDFNFGLFDKQMSNINGMNARLYQYQMKKGVSKTHEYVRDLLYNPMLKVYQDAARTGMPKGTYFCKNKPEQWYCYDHVLMKKPLLPRFDLESLQILGHLGSQQLVVGNEIDTSISDHLPIRFEISIEGGMENG